MCHHFKSTVHFVPSFANKEFSWWFLSPVLPPPSMEQSAALVLQFYLGDVSSKYNVFQLSDRRFHFSVCSNKIGHFSHGLRDIVWPDFHCHVHLFRGLVDSVALYLPECSISGLVFE